MLPAEKGFVSQRWVVNDWQYIQMFQFEVETLVSKTLGRHVDFYFAAVAETSPDHSRSSKTSLESKNYGSGTKAFDFVLKIST